MTIWSGGKRDPKPFIPEREALSLRLMIDSFELHAQLAADCIEVGRLHLSKVLLTNDSTYPWLILVPERPGLTEFYELDPMDRYRLSDEIVIASDVLRNLYNPDKMNVAALGNQVPQLHVHVIARKKTDPAWPGPIWGKVPVAPYKAKDLERRLADLRSAFAGP